MSERPPPDSLEPEGHIHHPTPQEPTGNWVEDGDTAYDPYDGRDPEGHLKYPHPHGHLPTAKQLARAFIGLARHIALNNPGRFAPGSPRDPFVKSLEAIHHFLQIKIHKK